MRLCTKCKIEKPDEDFWFNKRLGRIAMPCNGCRSIARADWKARNADKAKTKNREWQIANPDRVKAAMIRYQQKNPGLGAKRTAEWRANNRERALEAQRKVNSDRKRRVYDAYGGFRCACCGETEEAFLSIDHVNNDGAEHRRQVDRRSMYKWLEKEGFPSGYQVLCMNCNFGKARNGGVCPHETLKVQRLVRKDVEPSGSKRGALHPICR
jgi:hypothetical protein